MTINTHALFLQFNGYPSVFLLLEYLIMLTTSTVMLRPYGTLSLLSALMCEVIKDLMASHTEEETWSWVARDILLDTWTTLLMVFLYTASNDVTEKLWAYDVFRHT